MSERKIKRSPLVDVAGVLRSFDYAGRSAAVTAADRGVVPEARIDALDLWRREWVAAMQRRMLDEYLDEIGPAGLIPPGHDDTSLLLDLFLLEKALYEVRYELANRPHWVGWPLAAVSETLAGTVWP